jgi:hypothetical protein
MTWLIAGAHSLHVEAFFCRRPDENHERFYRFLLERDVEEHVPVCVLGAAAKRELFGFGNPVGKTIKIGQRLQQKDLHLVTLTPESAVGIPEQVAVHSAAMWLLAAEK